MTRGPEGARPLGAAAKHLPERGTLESLDDRGDEPRASHDSRVALEQAAPDLRVLLVSFTSLLQALYRRKVGALADQPGLTVEVLLPPYWRELWRKAQVPLEERGEEAYRKTVARVYFPGNLHLAVFREKVRGTLRRFRPEVIDLEDEPFNFGSLQLALMRRFVSPVPALVIHASQNTLKRYPPPFGWIERFVLRDADGFLARTEDAAAVLRAKGVPRECVRVVPHGVDVAAFSPLSATERSDHRERLGLEGFTVGFLGALTRQKGLETLLEAIARTAGVRAFIVGDGEHRGELAQYSRRLGVEDRVQFRSAVSHAETPGIFSSLDAFVLPSISLPGLSERFGRVLIEAMACATPVIGSSCGEIPRVIGDAGSVFPEGDVDALAHLLKRLRDDLGMRSRLGRAGRNRVLSHFSWDVVAGVTVETYRVALDRRRRQP